MSSLQPAIMFGGFKSGATSGGGGTCGCCGGGGCSVTICVTGCPSGSPLPGATVTITGVDTCITVMSGSTACCSINIATAGTYQLIVSATGYVTFTATLAMTCGETIQVALQPVTAPATVQFNVTGCCPAIAGGGNEPLPGAVITISDGQDCTTDSSGQCDFWEGNAGTYTYSISKSRFVTATGLFSISTCQGSTTIINVSLAPASGYACGPGYSQASGATAALNFPDPIPTTLHLSDSVYGACILTYSGGNWSGTISATSLAQCDCPAVTFTITYTLLSCATGSCFLGMSATYGTVLTGPGGIPIVSFCPCDSSQSLPGGEVFVCGIGNLAEQFCYTTGFPSNPDFAINPAVPFDFSGTIPVPTSCAGNPPSGPDRFFQAWYPAGATITITE